jgi:hypothetical protein
MGGRQRAVLVLGVMLLAFVLIPAEPAFADRPKAVNVSAVVAQNVVGAPNLTAAITLMATDTEEAEAANLTFRVVSQPMHSSAAFPLSCTPKGICAYTPATGYVGPDSFTFQASNDGFVNDLNISNTATASITVVPRPVAVADKYQTSADIPMHVAAPGVLSNDTQLTGDPLQAELDTLPAHGTLALHADGSFDYTPTLAFTGADSFKYHAFDLVTKARSPSVTVTVTVAVCQTNVEDFYFGSPGPDHVGFVGSCPSGLLIDLLGGNDIYDVFFGHLRGPVTAGDSGSSPADRLNVFGTAGSDAMRIAGNTVSRGTELVHSGGIEHVDVNAGNGNDSITVDEHGLQLPLGNVDGGAGTDHLVIDARALDARLAGNLVIVNGRAAFTYSGFEEITLLNRNGAQERSGLGYWLLASDGGVFTFGQAHFYGSTGNLRLKAPIIQMVSTPSGRGYWLLAFDGGVFSFGDAHFFGSTGNLRLKAPIARMVATATGRGYWLVAGDGGIFAFGDAPYLGSAAGVARSRPIVTMVRTPRGDGYWILEADGRVSAFGAAAAVARRTQPLPSGFTAVALVPTPSGRGFWFVTSNGYIEGYGDGFFFGSLYRHALSAPIVQMVGMPTGRGYWLLGRDGGIFSFGDAHFYGSTGGLHLKAPVSAIIPPGI